MARAAPSLHSFNAGELSPRLDGRTDIEKYHSGCRTMENFLPLVQGGALKRSGFRFVKPTPGYAAAPLQMRFDELAGAGSAALGDVVNRELGFEPKALIAVGTREASVTDVTGSIGTTHIVVGMATSDTERFCVMSTDTDAADPTVCRTLTSNDAFFGYISGSVTSELRDVSFNEGGYSTICDLATSSAMGCNVLALGGLAVRAAKLIEFDTRSTSGSQAITGAGFAPDTAIFLCGGSTAINVNAGGFQFSLGAAVKSPAAHAMSLAMASHNFTAADTARRYSDTVAIARSNNVTVAASASVSFDADGVTLSWTGSSTSAKAAVLLLDTGGAFELIDFESLTSVTTANVDGLRGSPRGGLIVSSLVASGSIGSTVADMEISIGGFDDSLRSGAFSACSVDAAAAADTGSSRRATSVYANPNPATPTVLDGHFSISELRPNGFEISQTDGDPSANMVWALAGSDAVAPVTKAVLVPFVFNEDDAYQVEFGDYYASFYRDNAPVYDLSLPITGATAANPVVLTITGISAFANGDEVLVSGVGGMTQLNGRWFTLDGVNVAAGTAQLKGVDGTGYSAYTSGGTAQRVYRIASPYVGDDLDSLQWRGQSDVLYIASPNHPPFKLSRFGNTDWTLEEVAFDHFPFSPENTDDDDFMASNVGTGAAVLTSSSGQFTADMVGEYVKLREVVEAYNPEWVNGQDLDAGKYEAFQANGASWAAGDRLQFEGRVYECVKRGAAGIAGAAQPTHVNGLNSDGNFDWRFVNYGYGYALITSVIDAFRVNATVVKEFPRSTLSPDKTVASMSTANPIVVTVTAHGWETGDRVFFRGITGTFGTAVNNTLQVITRIDANTFSIPLSGAGLTGGVGIALRMDTGTTVSGTGKLYPNLRNWSWGAWGPARGYPAAVAFFEDRLDWAGTPSNPQTSWLSRPGRYEDHAIFDENDSALVLTITSSDPIRWVLDQNALVIGTGGDEYASNRNATEPLSPENVHTIRNRARSGSRAGVRPVGVDNVILMVQRAGRKLLELVFDEAQDSLVAPDLTRLADHISLSLIKQLAFQREPNRVLWATLEDGKLLGFTYERDEQVFAWHRHPLGGTSAVAQSISTNPHPDGDGDQLWAIVERTIGGATVRSVEYLEKEWVRGMALEDAFCVDSGSTYDGAPTTSITGLLRLAGETVQVLADGLSVGPLVVSAAGVVTLTTAASVVQVGLGYGGVLETMRIDAGGGNGTARGKIQRIRSAVFNLEQTGEGLEYGPDRDNFRHFYEIAPGTLYSDETELLSWPAGHERGSRVALRHARPTPCTVLAVLPQLSTAD